MYALNECKFIALLGFVSANLIQDHEIKYELRQQLDNVEDTVNICHVHKSEYFSLNLQADATEIVYHSSIISPFR